MSRTLWLFGLSFIIWIPLAYIVVHRHSANAPEQPLPIQTQRQESIPVMAVQSTPATSKVVVPTELRPRSKSTDVAHLPSPLKKDKYQAAANKSRAPYDFLKSGGVSWNDFVKTDLGQSQRTSSSIYSDVNLIQCSANMEQALQRPGLSTEDFKWCQWTLDPKGGNVQVRVMIKESAVVSTVYRYCMR